jgi:hypothetical protein
MQLHELRAPRYEHNPLLSIHIFFLGKSKTKIIPFGTHSIQVYGVEKT